MGTEVVKSSWQGVGGFITPVKLLRSLGVPFKLKRNSFWLANEGELEYIFYDFQKRAREVKAELHPDAPTGSDEFFRKFSNDCDRVVRMFARRGIGTIIDARTIADHAERAHHRQILNCRVQAQRVGTRICRLKVCAKRFTPTHQAQRYCCRTHQIKGRNQRAYKRRRAFVKRYYRRCLFCGRQAVTTHSCKIYCSRHCSMRAAMRRFRKKHAVPLPEFFRTCPNCGKNFMTIMERKVFCSRHCKGLAHHARKKVKQLQPVAA